MTARSLATDRRCQECGGALVRRKKESPKDWNRRRYCSLACSIAVSKRHLQCIARPARW